MEKPVADGLAQEALDEAGGELFAVHPGGLDLFGFANGDGVDPAGGEDRAAGLLPEHVGDTEISVVAEIVGKLGHGSRFHAQIHLQHGRAGQRVDDFFPVEAARGGHEALGNRGQGV